MSFASVNGPDKFGEAMPARGLGPPAEEPNKPRYKSFKKKFLKLRHHFKNQMRENGRLFEEEHHATRVARRLQEQNDQLLDLLLDINESKRIPPFLRYDLRSPTPNLSDVPTLETDTGPYDRQDIEGARGALREAKGEYESGQISLIDYKATEASLTAIITAPQRPQTLTNLCRVTHTKLASVPPAGMPTDLVEGEPTGYLSPGHEDEYLAKLDAFIASTPLEAQTTLPRDPPPTEKEKEKEAQLHNPVSVYNWLRNHSDTKPLPHESEKEPSNTSETTHTRAKPSPKPPSFAGNGSTKPSRKSAASIPKPEPEEELLDEEGFVIGGASEPAGPKGKRKRDDDNAYRPKGGSSKSKKKAKGSGGAAVKKVEPEVEEDEEA